MVARKPYIMQTVGCDTNTKLLNNQLLFLILFKIYKKVFAVTSIVGQFTCEDRKFWGFYLFLQNLASIYPHDCKVI